jgi:hypothetical protein
MMIFELGFQVHLAVAAQNAELFLQSVLCLHKTFDKARFLDKTIILEGIRQLQRQNRIQDSQILLDFFFLKRDNNSRL